jgi:hypothetical protein
LLDDDVMNPLSQQRSLSLASAYHRASDTSPRSDREVINSPTTSSSNTHTDNIDTSLTAAASEAGVDAKMRDVSESSEWIPVYDVSNTGSPHLLPPLPRFHKNV